jgi:hypothetical protein
MRNRGRLFLLLCGILLIYIPNAIGEDTAENPVVLFTIPNLVKVTFCVGGDFWLFEEPKTDFQIGEPVGLSLEIDSLGGSSQILANGATFVISDNADNIIWGHSIGAIYGGGGGGSGIGVSWNQVDNNGNPVAPGIYKAGIIFTEPALDFPEDFSGIIPLTIIDIRTPAPEGWSEDIRLTDNHIASSHPSIAVDSDNHVHVIWPERHYDPVGGKYFYQLHYTKLDRSGMKLIPDISLSGPPCSVSLQSPKSITVDSQNNVHIVWKAGYCVKDWVGFTDCYEYFFYTKLDAHGNKIVNNLLWSANWPTSNPNQCHLNYPSIVVDRNDNLHISSLECGIYYIKLDNNGNPLIQKKSIAYGRELSIAVDSQDNVFLAFFDASDVAIHLMKLDNEGNIVIDSTKVSNTLNRWEAQPSIAIDSTNNIHLVWQDTDVDSTWQLYYMKLDNGVNAVVADKVITNRNVVSDWDWIEDLSATIDSSDNIHITWPDNRDGNLEIYYLRIDNNGNPLGGETRLTSYGGSSESPSIAVASDNKVCVTWFDNRHGYSDIYYKYQTVRTIDLVITDIKPIQTIQDIPLIKDKATMVRVFVKLEGVKDLQVIEAQGGIDFVGDRRPVIKRWLVNFKGKTYVFSTAEEANDFCSRAEKNPTLETTHWFKWQIQYHGINSINFDFPGKPLIPAISGDELKIRAEVTPVAVVDSNISNNALEVSTTVKSMKDDRLYILFQRARPWYKSFITNDDEYKKLAKNHFDFLVATYPIARKHVNPISSLEIEVVAPALPILPGVPQMASVIWFNKVIAGAGYWRGVYVVPHDWIGQGLSYTFCKRAVLVNEKSSSDTTAHEIGHTYDFPDVKESVLAADGWDVSHLTVGDAIQGPAKICVEKDDLSSIHNFYDFMSQNGGGWPPWISKDHYEKLMEHLISGGPDPRLLLVSGALFEDGKVDLYPFYSFSGIPDELTPGRYSFETISSDGSVLGSTSFEPIFEEDGICPFVFTIPYPNGTQKVILRRNDIALEEVVLTPNSPVVTIAPVLDLGGGKYAVQWEGTDADGDVLEYLVYYSHNGQDWLPLNLNYGDISLELDTSLLPGGNNSFIKIVTTDGVNTVETISDPFSVSNKPPSAFISRPSNDSVFTRGQDIVFAGWAYDPEEFELDGSSFVWTSSIDEVIGTGSSLTTSRLSVGNHTITLNVSDANGLSDSTAIAITVLLPGDFNIDYRVDFIDLAKFSSKWLDTCSEPNWCEGTDLDYSGRVNFVDFALFAEQWLWEKIPADIDIDGDVDFVDYAVFANNWMYQNCAEPNWCFRADLNKSGSVDLYDLAEFTDHWLKGTSP